MFGAEQLSRFTKQVSAARFKVFACRIAFRGLTLNGVSTSIKTGGQLAEAGFMFTHDAYARIPLLPPGQPIPTTGETLTIYIPILGVAGQQLRINEVHAHPNNPEWRLGLKCL